MFGGEGGEQFKRSEEEKEKKKKKEKGGALQAEEDLSDEEEDEEDLSDEEEYTEEEEDSDIEEAVSWIEWFCSLKGNEFFVEVDEEFIRDDFNLTGISSCVPHYDRAMDVILDTEEEEDLDESTQRRIDESAHLLFGLIHSRYILTNRGMQLMRSKYCESTFGKCRNTFCNGQSVLPIGLTDAPHQQCAKIFCPRCNEVFHPAKGSRLGTIDGAFFGTTFPHFFFLHFDSLLPRLATAQYYVPRIYGFKVYANVKDKLREMAQIKADRSSSSSSSSAPHLAFYQNYQTYNSAAIPSACAVNNISNRNSPIDTSPITLNSKENHYSYPSNTNINKII